MVEIVMAVSCFYNALLHLRVLCFDSCFLSCLAPRSAFTVLHHLNSHIIVVNVGAQSNMWNVDLASGPIRGAWHARLRPCDHLWPISQGPHLQGTVSLDWTVSWSSLLLKLSNDPKPKNLLYGGYVWEVSWVASVKPCILRPCPSRPRCGIFLISAMYGWERKGVSWCLASL